MSDNQVSDNRESTVFCFCITFVRATFSHSLRYFWNQNLAGFFLNNLSGTEK